MQTVNLPGRYKVQGSDKHTLKMAVDGRKLSDNLSNSQENACIPCARDGTNVAAIKYCVECDETLCLTCLNHHNRFPMMIRHQTLDKLNSQTAKKRQELPIKTCDTHGGKLVDLYCADHDSVGCSECFTKDHSFCQRIQYISCIANEIQPQKEISELETKLQDLLTRLDQRKQQKQDHLTQLQQTKENLLKEIHELRKKINELLDKMENNLVEEVESKLKLKMQLANEGADAIMNMKSSIEERQNNIRDAKGINDAETFVQVKLGISMLQENEHTLNGIDNDGDPREMIFIPNRDIQMLLSNCDKPFGQISEILIPKSTKHAGDFSVRSQNDTLTCMISDGCLTSSGSFIIVDVNNNRIKKLDQSFTVTEVLDLPDSPNCLCEIDSTQVAVTLRDLKKVQMVSQQPLTMGNSFTTGSCCRGINYHKGQIYVCCGGLRGEGHGHIEVYDTDGVLLRSLYEGLNKPLRIRVLNKDKMLISDNDKNDIFSCNMSFNAVSEMKILGLCEPAGSCRFGGGQLCIAGWKSNNVVLISGDGEHQQELLTKKDGITNPLAVIFDDKRSRLLVFLQNSDIIKVFDIVF